MSEVKKCIRSLAVCYLLLAVTIFPETGMLPIRFPTYRFSSVYLLLLSVCLILRYYLTVAERKNVMRLRFQDKPSVRGGMIPLPGVFLFSKCQNLSIIILKITCVYKK